eukprot:8044557-Prorocentrum_lima.AAC.1
MTSSLVGSEMCIRDRSSEAVEHFAGQILSMGASPSNKLGPGKHSLKTVSYTHLTLPTICSV